MIRIDQLWLAVEPLDMRAGADRALQSLGGALAKTLGAIQPLLEKQRM